MTAHRKEPLYRKVNTRARGVHHRSGGDFRHARHARDESLSSLGSMHAGKQRGLDYTPLFRFLLSRVGEDWDAVHSEAVARLDRAEPIFRLVARTEAERKPAVLVGENAYYSGLYVDAENRLALVDPGLRNEDMRPTCGCCTHSFNGKPFVRPYQGD